MYNGVKMQPTVTLDSIRSAQIRAGLTPTKADEEMQNLMDRLKAQTGEEIESVYVEEKVVPKPKPARGRDPEIEAQQALKEKLAETCLKGVPADRDYWDEVRRKMEEY
jgi:hypothetical protein